MITAKDVAKAHKILNGVVVNTPLEFDHYLSEKYGAKIYLKKENAQRVRSFKIRGAYYAISQLSKEERERGVVCASAGNHAQGVAYTCNEMKIPATIFMPITTPQQKIGQVRFFGGDYVTIKLVGDTFDASAKAAQEFTLAEKRTFIDPFDDPNVQAGQGTVAYEILEEARKESIAFDTVLVPVGGGGLISGVSTYIKETEPKIEVIGVEAEGARSMKAAFEAGGPVKLPEIDKFADGIAVQKVGQLTYEVTRQHVETLIGVDEGLISETLIDLYSKQGIVAEPALIYDGVKHYFIVNFPQRPGALREFVNDILGPNDDITRFEYIKRASKGTGPVLIGVTLANKHDYAGLVNRIERFDPFFINLNGNETLYNMLV